MYPYGQSTPEQLADASFAHKEGDDTQIVATFPNTDGSTFIDAPKLKSDMQMTILSAITKVQGDIVNAQAIITAKTATLAKLNTANTTINSL